MTELRYDVQEDLFDRKMLAAKIVLTDNQQYQLIAADGSKILHTGSLNTVTFINANGADGKHGTNGRDGQKGATGLPGNNAYLERSIFFTREISGTNGGPGGNGSDATAGTSGTDGKDGGNIAIYYDDSDVDLLDALKLSAQGGAGGRAGRHGRAGQGGDGGAGGRSSTYTVWIESVHYHNHYSCHDDFLYSYGHHCHYSDPSLSFHPHQHGHPHVDITYIPIQRTISGGQNGPTGSPGYQPTHALYDGKKGSNGNITYHTNGQTHAQPYQFKFKDIKYKGESLTAVPKRFEYGEVVEVHALLTNQPRNLSVPHTMSTPHSNQVLVSSTEGIKLLQASHVDPIAPNAQMSTDASNPIRFQLLHPQSIYHQRLELPFAVYNPRLNRPYQGATQTYAISAGYPVSLAPINANMSVLSGETLSIQTTVQHDQAIKREIHDKRQAKIMLSQNGHDTEILADQHTWQIPFQSTDTNNAYNQTLDISLHWPLLGDSSDTTNTQWREINCKKINVLVTPKYQPNDSGYVLVVNDSTPAEEINLISNQLKSLTKSESIPIYNVSTNASKLDITQVIKDHKERSVFIFNNVFTVANKRTKLSLEMPVETEYLAADSDVSLLLTERDGNRYIQKRAISASDSVKSVSSMRDLFAQLFQDDLAKKNVYKLQTGRPVNQAKLSDKLNRHFPARFYEFTSDENNDIWIQQIPQSPVQESIFWAIADIVKAAPFVQKLRDALKHPSLTDHHHGLYLQAIIEDLQTERASLVGSYSYMTLQKTYRHDFTKELTKLNRLLTHVKQMQEKDLILFMPMLIKVLAETQYQAQKQTSFWTWLASFFIIQNDEALAKSTGILVDKILDNASRCDKNAKAKVTLQTDLKHLVGKRNNHAFFRPKEETINAADALLNACETLTKPVKDNSSKQLKDLYAEYDRCYNTTPSMG